MYFVADGTAERMLEPKARQRKTDVATLDNRLFFRNGLQAEKFPAIKEISMLLVKSVSAEYIGPSSAQNRQPPELESSDLQDSSRCLSGSAPLVSQDPSDVGQVCDTAGVGLVRRLSEPSK